MSAPTQIVLRAATRFYVPLATLFALSLLATRPAGAGIGFVAGGAASFGLALYLMTLGALALRAAFPPAMARLVLALGMIAALAAAGLPGFAYADRLAEAGLFAVTFASAALILLVIAGRAPTMRDEDWQ